MSYRGPTQALAWLYHPDSLTKGLVFGTGFGWLCVWTLDETETERKFQEVYCVRLQGGPGSSGREIVSLAYDALKSQLAVAHGSVVIHVFNLNRQFIPESRPDPAFTSISIPDHHPVGIFFGREQAEGRLVWSVGRDDGRIIMMSNNRLLIEQDEATGLAIGAACISPEQDTLVVDDVAQGPSLFRLSDDGIAFLKNLPIPSNGEIPRSVQFHLESSTAVVTGSSHGRVYILDRPTAAEIDILETGKASPVQVVDAGRDDGGAAIIVCSHSDEHARENELQLWKRRGAETFIGQAPVRIASTTASSRSGTTFNVLLGAFVFLLALHVKDQIVGWSQPSV
ncbi:hypothetical protein CYLTODRAFT_459421 [Cylindrobasidium torrendii FP15055 ss-10]|uniref:WD40 repeat-like protein n=1 Tax=Cylindrobasidium torrendii FP15055 ss-10 TaxID=1314674 RepID=A0A0D7AU97_9AGAR|nr:hypothetical protein CYLTODRAFT_459421 [Cylindrobasidium torrendii FP15055 ss-10]